MEQTLLLLTATIFLLTAPPVTLSVEANASVNRDARAMTEKVILPATTDVDKTQAITIRFRAGVGDKPFNCAETYNGIGTTGSSVKVTDFRFFVTDVRLIDAKGNEFPVSLSNDGKWQNERVALVAFESGERGCGADQTNMEVKGTAAIGSYVGLRLSIGVPPQENHVDPATAPSPLNLTRMFWSWNAGYKFMRLEMNTSGQPKGYVLHLGSTDCRPSVPGDVSTTQCSFENRPDVYLAQFNPLTDVVQVNVKALYDGVNVDVNQENTGVGCMSAQRDSDCAGVFKNLGLPFSGARPVAQSFMRAEKFVKSDVKPSN